MGKIGQSWNHQCIMPTPPWPWNNVKVLKTGWNILQLSGGGRCVLKKLTHLLNSAHSIDITHLLVPGIHTTMSVMFALWKRVSSSTRLYMPHTKNVMHLHAWPRVSEILPASLSTGKSLGLRHLTELAALFICPVLSDPGCFLFRNRLWEWWTDTNHAV